MTNEIIITGKIKIIKDVQTFDSGFKKREVVITTDEQSPQDLKVEFFKDRCDILDNYKIDDIVEVWISLRGNEYQGKYYVSIIAYKIKKNEKATNEFRRNQELDKTADSISNETIGRNDLNDYGNVDDGLPF
jgi:hypothetical protein